MLRAVDLQKTFYQGVEHTVIQGVDLTIEEREFLVITGKSGSGKSTLLYLLSGLEKPTRGRVEFRGKNLAELNDGQMSRLRRTSFGFIFQFYNLVASLNVEDNILLPLSLERRLTREDREQAYAYATEIGVADKKKSFPYQLSGGEQQRVAIARALAMNPDIIFADEPTGNLDTVTREEVLRVFADLNQKYGKTVVMVTHDESIGARFATREIVIENGRVIS